MKFCAPIVLLATVLFFGLSCSKDTNNLRFEFPAGYTGWVTVEFGSPDAQPLQRKGGLYVITVPRDGRVVTSTYVDAIRPEFPTMSAGQVWNYSSSVSKTGDGIPVGAKIRFFVGPRERYEAENSRINPGNLQQQ